MQELKWVCLDNSKKCKDDRNINTMLLFRALFVKRILAAWFSSVRGMFFDSFTRLPTDILIHIHADIPWISGDLGTAQVVLVSPRFRCSLDRVWWVL